MTEFHIIGLGNLCEFVIKNIDEKQTYGTFSACDKHDRKSMQEFVDYVNQLIKENEKLKERIKELQKESYGNLDGLNYYQEQNGHLSSKISDLECENEQLKSDKEHLMGYLIRFCRFDDENLDYVMNTESNREYGKQYYEMKEETKKEL